MRQKKKPSPIRILRKAASLRDRSVISQERKKENINNDWREKSKEKEGVVVDAEVIAEVVAKMTGIPLTRLSSEDAVRLL